MKNYLEKLKAHELFNMVQFVVSENFKHHTNNLSHEGYELEVNSIYDEELTYYQSSEVFVSKNPQGSISGTIRVMKWNYVDPLPIQKLFKINPFQHVDKGSVNDIYHIGRFAIQKDLPSLGLFKQLIASAIIPVCKHKKNVAFAECDQKLLRTLFFLGIKIQIIGKSLEYLGSETIPILLTYDGLIDFYNRSRKQICNNTLGMDEESNVDQLAI